MANERNYIDDYSHLNVGDEYKGRIIESLSEEGHPCARGRNLVKNTFLSGNNFGRGRKKGSRNKMTQQMLDMVANARISPAEYLMDVLENTTSLPEERLKAAMKLVDIVYPKAASVEIDVSGEIEMSGKELDDALATKLKGLTLSVVGSVSDKPE